MNLPKLFVGMHTDKRMPLNGPLHRRAPMNSPHPFAQAAYGITLGAPRRWSPTPLRGSLPTAASGVQGALVVLGAFPLRLQGPIVDVFFVIVTPSIQGSGENKRSLRCGAVDGGVPFSAPAQEGENGCIGSGQQPAGLLRG